MAHHRPLERAGRLTRRAAGRSGAAAGRSGPTGTLGPIVAVDPAPPRPAAGPLTTRPSGHVWAIDVIRLLTFGAVIAVHCVAYTIDPADVAANGAMLLLQFGREVFFSITGFVLVWSSIGRPVAAGRFWRRRFTFVLTPYLVWTLLYYLTDLIIAPYPAWSWSTLGWDVIDGGAFYHLYFLLVSMQLYLVFPLLARFVRRTAARAGWWLVAIGVVDVAWLAVLQYVPAPTSGAGRWMWDHAYEILPTYALYVLAGCYAALWWPTLQGLLRRHPRRALGVAAACTAGALGAFAAELRWMDPRTAGNVLQPAMTLACLAAVIVVGLVGVRWADGPRRGEAAVALGSDLSFGVYLAHPLVLTFLLNNGLGTEHQVLPQVLCCALAWVAVVLGATGLSWLARATPLSIALIGRSRVRSRGSQRAVMRLSRPGGTRGA